MSVLGRKRPFGACLAQSPLAARSGRNEPGLNRRIRGGNKCTELDTLRVETVNTCGIPHCDTCSYKQNSEFLDSHFLMTIESLIGSCDNGIEFSRAFFFIRDPLGPWSLVVEHRAFWCLNLDNHMPRNNAGEPGPVETDDLF